MYELTRQIGPFKIETKGIPYGYLSVSNGYIFRKEDEADIPSNFPLRVIQRDVYAAAIPEEDWIYDKKENYCYIPEPHGDELDNFDREVNKIYEFK